MDQLDRRCSIEMPQALERPRRVLGQIGSQGVVVTAHRLTAH